MFIYLHIYIQCCIFLYMFLYLGCLGVCGGLDEPFLLVFFCFRAPSSLNLPGSIRIFHLNEADDVLWRDVGSFKYHCVSFLYTFFILKVNLNLANPSDKPRPDKPPCNPPQEPSGAFARQIKRIAYEREEATENQDVSVLTWRSRAASHGNRGLFGTKLYQYNKYINQ